MSDEPGDDTADKPTPTTERWTFGGTRLNAKKARVHEWIDPSGAELGFKARGQQSVGCVYEVKVERKPNGGVSLYMGQHRYVGPSEDVHLREQLFVRHRAAETELALIQRERRAKADDPLELAIDRLAYLIRHTQNSHQRTSLVAYVMRRLFFS